MQEITYDNVIQKLLEAIPEFRADEKDVADHRGTFLFEDLARFVKVSVEANDDELMRRSFRFREAADALRALSKDITKMDCQKVQLWIPRMRTVF
jgi:hypothetical protein